MGQRPMAHAGRLERDSHRLRQGGEMHEVAFHGRQRVVNALGPASSRALDAWSYARQVQLALRQLGKPVENAYLESFHN